MVSLMIKLYCNKKHHTKGTLCEEYAGLNEYARLRSDKCPFMETKTFCPNCKQYDMLWKRRKKKEGQKKRKVLLTVDKSNCYVKINHVNQIKRQ